MRSPAVIEALKVLGLRPNATVAEIRSRFRALAKTMHPDVGGNPEQWVVVQAAYDKVVKREQEDPYVW
jgi:curved DNA-binding protein CbpA